MGLVQELDYEVPQPNAVQRAVWRVTSSKPGAWLFARTSHHIDRFLLKVSGGRWTAARLLAGKQPSAEVVCNSRTVTVLAREAEGSEWQEAWDRARQMYSGYEAYARRITDRKIHIMVLSRA